MTTLASPRAGRREWIGLGVLALPTILVALDMSVLYLAIPHLATSLGASDIQQLWITDIYGFVLAGLLVTMGHVGDRVGRKRLLLIGGAAFAVASVLAACSTSPEMLIATRALLGVAGATIMPSTMSLIHTMFTDRKQHATAMAIWMGCFMGGSALGPVLGGAVLEYFWWGAAFLIGVPVMVVLLVLGPVWLPEHRNPGPARLDVPSVALSLVAVLAVVYGLKELSRNGFGAGSAGAVVAGLCAGYVFVARQRRLTTPLLDLGLFRNRVFRAGLLLTVVAGLTAGNTLFVSLYLQRVEGLSTLQTALWLLPSTLAMLLVIQVSPLLTRHIRTPLVIGGGLVVAAAGFLLLTQVDGGLPLMITGMVVQSIGIGPMGGLCAIMAMQAVHTEEAGAAAALTETAGELGLATGVAVLGVVGMAVARGDGGLVGGLNASAAICAGVVLLAAALVVRLRT
ncbi:MFS transporter [Actinophytocola algeriensis]|uniref:DHA2 family multidrug resistance protein-like MFS transporter n=1 Tax=Actinophytocola algeriensis TaxID=1768010 RepID=A0A7W7VHB4_9PSEU|nr:MFS transporter [Actinophytocola algeriensis]MBB4909900.1 DHA2 family multidrug resistance protein-like MFS transporter [Actinophytocola algeriensis]MBE1475890.1 DHA2 family multidrug resistance protein-like MFS transporter [Actinophytocola algeriensis]